VEIDIFHRQKRLGTRRWGNSGWFRNPNGDSILLEENADRLQNLPETAGKWSRLPARLCLRPLWGPIFSFSSANHPICEKNQVGLTNSSSPRFSANWSQ
jgi:hypothetical protein